MTGIFLIAYFCGRARKAHGYDFSRLSGSKNEGAIIIEGSRHDGGPSAYLDCQTDRGGAIIKASASAVARPTKKLSRNPPRRDENTDKSVTIAAVLAKDEDGLRVRLQQCHAEGQAKTIAILLDCHREGVMHRA